LLKIAHAEALSKAQLSELHMTKVEEEKDQSRRADKVIKHRAALCRLLAHRVNARQRSISVAFGAKRTLTEPRLQNRIDEYTPFCNGPGDVKSPRVIVTPPSSRFCPWSAPRPPHYAVRRNGEPI
jgi:hypothetical protein